MKTEFLYLPNFFIQQFFFSSGFFVTDPAAVKVHRLFMILKKNELGKNIRKGVVYVDIDFADAVHRN